MKIEKPKRLRKLPPYLFLEIDKIKKKAIEDGLDVGDLGIGDPDMQTLKPVVDEMARAIRNPEYHRYPLGSGMRDFRNAAAAWFARRFGVQLDSGSEVLCIIGSKEGIGHAPLAYIDAGDTVLVPDPGYPVYNAGTIFAGGIPYVMPLLEKNNFLPDLKVIPPQVLKKAKLMFINYPNNPTSAVAGLDFYRKVVAFAKKHNIMVCSDAAYSEVYYGGKKPVSFLQVKCAKEVGVECHSLSKTFNMTGWRVGFCAGNGEMISLLASVKGNLDSGVFHAIQKAGIKALSLPQNHTDRLRAVYKRRRDVLSGTVGGRIPKAKIPSLTSL